MYIVCVPWCTLKFAGKVEADVGEVVLGHLQDVVGVGQEDVAALLVGSHVLLLAALEGGKLFFVVALYPAGFVEADGFPAALGAILVQQTVLYYLELQLADGAYDLAAVEGGGEELRHALVHELADAVVELLGFHGVGVLDVLEHLRREAGQPLEMEVLAGGQCVADFKVAGVGEADDVAGPRLVDDALFLGHEGGGGGEAHLLALADVVVIYVALEAAGADFDEGYAGAVVGVHVGVDLEHEAGEGLFPGVDYALHGLDGPRLGGYLHEAVEEFLDAEGVEGRAEEDGCELAAQVCLLVEVGVDAFDELQVFAELGGIFLADACVDLGGVDVGDLHAFGDGLLVGCEEVEAVLVDVIYSFEACAHVDGPGEGADGDVEFGLELVEDVEGVAALAVHLVDEDDDRGVAHAADLHKAPCLGLHALGGVDDDDYRIDGGEGAEGILCEVLVARRGEDIDFIRAIVEAHDRGGHGDAALFLNLHPVGGGGLLYLVALHGSGHMDGSAVEEQFLGQSCLAGVRVRDYGKGAPAGYFVFDFGRHDERCEWDEGHALRRREGVKPPAGANSE